VHFFGQINPLDINPYLFDTIFISYWSNINHVDSGAIMTFDEFLKSVDDEKPSPQLSETLISLWWDKKGDWDTAHSIVQDIPTEQGSAVHAYLHREEGVLWNADYWYSRAGRKRPDIPLEAEWKQLVEEMLKQE
jgi:putative component of toxin-antitoxin plasmid stabilization module